MLALARTVVGILLLALALSGRAVAAPPPSETVSLRYDAPPSCPDRDAFVSRVDARGGALRLSDERAGARRIFVVRIEERDGRFSGDVAVHSDGRETHRGIETEACEELVDALALITVLAVDPGEPEIGAAVAARTRGQLDRETPAAETGRRRGFAMSVGVAGAIGIAPRGLPALPVVAELDDRRLGRVQLVAQWGRRTADLADGVATFDWLLIQLDGCPAAAIVELRSLSLGVCAGIQLGALRGRGDRIEGSRAETRPWVAPVLGGHLRRRLTTRWFAELDAGFAFPLVRDHFYFMPAVTIHRVPGVVLNGAITLGVAFP